MSDRLEALLVHHREARVAVLVLRPQRLDLHERARVDALGDLAAEHQVHAAGHDDRVERGVRDEAGRACRPRAAACACPAAPPAPRAGGTPCRGAGCRRRASRSSGCRRRRRGIRGPWRAPRSSCHALAAARKCYNVSTTGGQLAASGTAVGRRDGGVVPTAKNHTIAREARADRRRAARPDRERRARRRASRSGASPTSSSASACRARRCARRCASSRPRASSPSCAACSAA